jgi:hypothetical protein
VPLTQFFSDKLKGKVDYNELKSYLKLEDGNRIIKAFKKFFCKEE